MNGRKTDVLVTHENTTNLSTGLETFWCFYVWADIGYEQIIKAIEGVSYVNYDALAKGLYRVQVDPRYDRDYLEQEIIAAIKCNNPKQPTP